ncbi:MAG: hypothetical protein ABIC04_00810 [Nanoarchaeota archaeon]
MNKKSMYFTLMTIIFLAIFTFIYLLPQYQRLSSSMIPTEMRIDSMNDFIKDLQRDTQRGLYISSYRSLLAMEQYIISNGKYVNDSGGLFIEALLDGTIYGRNYSIMAASTFRNWIDKIKSESASFNIQANITIRDIRLFQRDSWNVIAAANLTFEISDITGIASWKRDEYIESRISIIDFEDPVYIVSSLGRTTNTINITPFEDNYTYYNGGWNVSNLVTHLQRSYYTSSTDGPSFLQRLEGNFTSSEFGIESLVNLKKLNDQGLQVDTSSSVVDYHYWNSDGNGDYRINFTPSWFRLDFDHLAVYEVESLSYEE